MSQENRRCNEDADPGLRPAVMAPRLKPLVWVTLVGLMAASVVGIGVRALADLHERDAAMDALARYEIEAYDRQIHADIRAARERAGVCKVGTAPVFDGARWTCIPLSGGQIATTGNVTLGPPLTNSSGANALGSSLTDVHAIGGNQPPSRGCGRLGRPGVCP